LLLPVVRDDGDLDWAEYRSALAPGRWGVTEPVGVRLGRAAVADAEVVVVPAVAVATDGTRLGRGGGCYDRALVRARGRVIAVVYDDELLPEVPAEAHDLAVDLVLTPGRTFTPPGR
jgi:5-formyltetrahydrofolate cyclo-ligase